MTSDSAVDRRRSSSGIRSSADAGLAHRGASAGSPRRRAASSPAAPASSAARARRSQPGDGGGAQPPAARPRAAPFVQACALLLQAADDVQDLLAVERLLDVGGGSRLQAARRVLLPPLGADDDHRQVGALGVGAQLGEELQPVHVGHVDVQQDEVDVRVLPQPVEGLPAVRGIDQRVLAEHDLVHLVHQLRVVDDEHFPWLQGSLPDPVDRGSPGGSLATNPKALKPAEARTFRDGRRGSGKEGNWWSRRESNPRPLECHSSALPTELRPQARKAA